MLRPLIAGDAEAFYGRPIDWPIAGLAIERDGRVIAMGGVAWRDDGCFGFLDCPPEHMPSPRAAIRLARMVVFAVKAAGEDEVMAARDSRIPMSDKFLRLVGFKPSGTADGVEIWTA